MSSYPTWIPVLFVSMLFGVGFSCRKHVSSGQSKTVVVCEHYSQRISCPDGKVIRIESATYGRSDYTTCKHTHMQTTTCNSDRTDGIVKRNCNNRRSCVLQATNGLYGDPCVYTYKYLTVKYTCA